MKILLILSAVYFLQPLTKNSAQIQGEWPNLKGLWRWLQKRKSRKRKRAPPGGSAITGEFKTGCLTEQAPIPGKTGNRYEGMFKKDWKKARNIIPAGKRLSTVVGWWKDLYTGGWKTLTKYIQESAGDGRKHHRIRTYGEALHHHFRRFCNRGWFWRRDQDPGPTGDFGHWPDYGWI